MEGLSGLHIGDKVIAWLDSGVRVERGVVTQARMDTFCVVDFDDGSFSTDLYQSRPRARLTSFASSYILNHPEAFEFWSTF